MAFTAEECLKIYSESLSETLHNATIIGTQPYEALILDYNLPDRNGLEVAKEILAINPHQRIIFVTANVDVLSGHIKQLKMPVEVLQKPVPNEVLVNTIEDKEIYDELKRFAFNPEDFKNAGLSHEVLRKILDILKKKKNFPVLFILIESMGTIGNNFQHALI